MAACGDAPKGGQREDARVPLLTEVILCHIIHDQKSGNVAPFDGRRLCGMS
jgi:hypothetical protein